MTHPIVAETEAMLDRIRNQLTEDDRLWVSEQTVRLAELYTRQLAGEEGLEDNIQMVKDNLNDVRVGAMSGIGEQVTSIVVRFLSSLLAKVLT